MQLCVAIFNDREFTSYGLTVQNSTGHVVATKAGILHPHISILEAENISSSETLLGF